MLKRGALAHAKGSTPNFAGRVPFPLAGKSQLLRYLEAVELRGVLAHQLAFVSLRHFAEFAGQDFLRMGPCRGAMWIVSRPHEVISADVTIYLQAEWIIDERRVDLPAKIVSRLQGEFYIVRLLICVVVVVCAGQ